MRLSRVPNQTEEGFAGRKLALTYAWPLSPAHTALAPARVEYEDEFGNTDHYNYQWRRLHRMQTPLAALSCWFRSRSSAAQSLPSGHRGHQRRNSPIPTSQIGGKLI